MLNRLHSPVVLNGAAAALAVGLAFAPPMSATAAPPPAHSLDSAAAAVMRLPAPQVQRYRARDGAALAYRVFEPASQAGPPAVVAILLHGSAGSSLNMTVLGEALAQVGVTAFNGAQALDFNLPPGAEALGLTRAWSYRMMINYGPRGQTQLFGRPAYWRDAARAPAPIVVIAGTADEQFYADRYAIAFKGLARPVRVELAPGVDHMGVVSDPRAVPLIVAAVRS